MLVHDVSFEDSQGYAQFRDFGDQWLGGGAQHQDLVDQHVKVQHYKPEGDGHPHHACQLGHLE